MWINNKRIPAFLWLLAWFFSLSGCYSGDEQGFRDAVELNELGVTAIELRPDPLMDPLVINKRESLKYNALAHSNNSDTLLDISDLVDWSTTDPSVASITQAGVVTGLGVGSVEVRAELAGLYGTKALDVSNAKLVTIDISSDLDSPMRVGVCTHGYQLAAKGHYDDGGAERILTGRVNWRSSSSTTAKVDSRGLIATYREGPVNLTASYTDVTDEQEDEDEIVSNTLGIVVGLPKLESIAVTPVDETVTVGRQLQFTAKGTYTSVAQPVDITKTVKWQTTVATASKLSFSEEQQGLATGLAEGEAKVTATCEATPTAPIGSEETAVTVVKPRTLERVAIYYQNVEREELRIGLINSPEQLTAKLIFSDGETQDVTDSEFTKWRVKDNPDGSSAKVNNTGTSKGLVTFTAIGTTVIEVSYNKSPSPLKVDEFTLIVE